MSSYFHSLNKNNSHSLIPKQETYHLSSKLLTVHAIDRDTRYYPDANNFGINCPQNYTNVVSIKLTEISFPTSIYNFSDILKNNKFYYELSGNDSSVLPLQTQLTVLNISNGYYTPYDLEYTLNKQLIDISATYNPITHKMEFNSTKQFTFYSYYNYYQSDNANNLKTDFLNMLGMDISENSFKDSKKNLKISSHNYKIIPINISNFLDTQPIYMEIDKYDTYDELDPFPKNSNNLYNNSNNSTINTAFIKLQPKSTIIPIYHSTIPYPKIYIHNNYSMRFNHNNSIIEFNQPICRIQNLKFKFRYHDGRLVDLQKQDVNFTLEINQLHNEIPNQLNVR